MLNLHYYQLFLPFLQCFTINTVFEGFWKFSFSRLFKKDKLGQRLRSTVHLYTEQCDIILFNVIYLTVQEISQT